MPHSHDPFRARPHTVTATPKALLGVASHQPAGTYTADDVPEKAAEAAAWVNAAEGEDAVARAQAAKAVEDTRSEPRKTVVAAIEGVLG